MMPDMAYCPDPPLTPPEHKGQDRINYLADLTDAELRINAFLEEFMELFPAEIKSFLIDVKVRVNNEMENDDG